METLHRVAKHLPGRRLLGQLPPEDRLDVDVLGTVWVTEDPLLIILKGHLIIETALVDICDRLLRNPSALERNKIGFSARLNLVCALLDPDYLPPNIFHALRDLNRLRNDLAHNLEPADFDTTLERFFRRFDEFEDLRPLHDSDRAVANRLTGCIAFLCGILGNIGTQETA
jgi:hypothetical protein